MRNRKITVRRTKLLKYQTKNEMVPTFFSGVFLSSAINILTSDTSRMHFFEMLSMGIMFFSSILFFLEASKIHELQTWYDSLTDVEKQNEDYFLNNTTIWDLGKWKNFYKKTIPMLPVFAWITGLLSLPIYFLSSDIEKLVPEIGRWISQLRW